MKDESRTVNSIKNSFVSILYNCLNILIAFIAQSIFIKTLGSEYNGIKSLFLNLLSMLSVVELGFGVAVVYNLYKPVANKDYESIKAIMKFYRKIYRIIAIIIFALGLILLPFIPTIVGKTNVDSNLYLIFLLFLVNSCCTYLFSYKRSILYASQKNFIINLFDLLFNFIKNALQILILIIFKNFYIYLLVQIAVTMINNMCISIFVNKKFTYLKKVDKNLTLDKSIKDEIINKVKGLLFHKIGGFFVAGTDNILISMSKNLGVIYVGYYSNYNMIISNVALVFSTMISSITASVGNLLVEKSNDYQRKLQTYRSVFLINSWLYCFGATSIYILAQDFIEIWLGKEYVLPQFVLLILAINFYINGTKIASNTFKEAAGIFYEDRFMPIIESIVNIFASLLFMHFFGLAGVFMGTITSSIVLLFVSYPIYMYKKVFLDKAINYFKLYFKYFIISTIVFVITLFISNLVRFENIFLDIFIKMLICLIVSNLIYFVCVFKDKNYRYAYDNFIIKTIKRFFSKRKSKN